MKQTISFGRLLGIEIGANWTLLVIAALIATSLGAEVLPSLEPGEAAASYWATAAAMTVAFFLSLLTHELGHALVARRHGVPVEQITLWLFGGAAKMRRDSPGPREEILIGGIGPAVSVGLGAAFFVAASATAALGAPDLVVTGLAWLAFTNAVLAVFNLLPAFPLDGGRVLRGVLWLRNHDRVRATLTAGQIGEAVAYGLVVVGLLIALAGGGLNGVWLVFLGWFLHAAAAAESQRVQQEWTLGGLLVRDVMVPDPVVVPATCTVEELVERYVLRARHSAYPVLDDAGRPRGLVTLDDIRRLEPAARSTTLVAQIAAPLDRLVVARPDELLTAVVERVTGGRFPRVLVVEGGRLVGLLTGADVLHAVQMRSLLPAPPPPPPPGRLAAPNPVATAGDAGPPPDRPAARDREVVPPWKT